MDHLEGPSFTDHTCGTKHWGPLEGTRLGELVGTPLTEPLFGNPIGGLPLCAPLGMHLVVSSRYEPLLCHLKCPSWYGRSGMSLLVFPLALPLWHAPIWYAPMVRPLGMPLHYAT